MASSPLHTKVRVRTNVAGLQQLASWAAKRNVTLKGAKAAGKVLKVAARSAAPRRKGRGGGSLRQAQGVLAKKGSKGKTVSFVVQGARKGVDKTVVLKGRKTPSRVVPAFYDHLVQLGTRPHRLGKGESLGRSGKRKVVVRTAQTTGRMHPGTPANPFRKRAWAAADERAAEAAVEAMVQATADEMRKQSRRVFSKIF